VIRDRIAGFQILPGTAGVLTKHLGCNDFRMNARRVARLTKPLWRMCGTGVGV
jgi:hypothetical protein